jgi:excisionase family DNA binding protein
VTEWLTVREAADRLGVHPETIYDGCHDGTVPHRRVGRTLRIPSWWTDGTDLVPARATAPEPEPGAVLTLLARDDDEVDDRERTRTM